jgi:hypothetical protein
MRVHVLTQSPPILAFSTIAADFPNVAANYRYDDDDNDVV